MSARDRLARLERAHEAATPPPAVTVVLGDPGETVKQVRERLNLPADALVVTVSDQSTPRPTTERKCP